MGKTGYKHTNSYIKLSDKELIALAKDNEQIAFTILFERYHYGLISHISEILKNNGVNVGLREMSEEPQDICQETFDKAFRNIGKYNSKFKFTTWLYNIAKNTTIDYIRRSKNTENSLSTDSNSQDIRNLSNGIKDNPEDKLIGSQEFENAKDIINHLSDKYRDAIYLYAVEGYGYEEIAKELNIQISTAKVRVNRAKNQLAAILKDSPLAQKRAKKIGAKKK